MKLYTIQYLRAIASIAVVYSHAVIQVDAYEHLLTEAGSFGVDIFFVISGFIMVYIAKPNDTPKRFFINRVRRVVPLYWFFTLLMAAILLLMPEIFKNSAFSWSAFLKSLLFIPDYSIADPNMVWPILAPGWSLNYEMYFYLLFALSLFLPAQWRIAAITLCITAVFFLATAATQASAAQLFYADTIVFEFVFGMLLALAFKRGFKLPQLVAVGLFVAGFAVLLWNVDAPRIVAFGLPALAIVTATLFINLPANRFGLLLGDSSYALYLVHIFTLGVLRKILPPFLGDGMQAAVLFTIIATVICIISGIVVHYLVDNWLLTEARARQIGNLWRGRNNNRNSATAS